MTQLLSLVVGVCLLCSSAAAVPRSDDPPRTATDLQAEASKVFYSHEFDNARGLLRRALAASPSAEQRVEIEVSLATLAWRYYGDTAEARAHLAAAESAGVKRSDAPAERARMETHLGDYGAARAAALQSLGVARTPTDRTRAKVAFANAVIEQALASRLDGKGALPALPIVRQALAFVQPIVVAEPGSLAPSRLEIGLALLAGDGRAVLEGWRSYFRVSAAVQPGSVLAGPSTELSRLLPRWTGVRSSSTPRIAAALGASRLFDEAALAMPSSGSIGPERESIAYAKFARRARLTTEEYYRTTAIGHGDDGKWKAQLFGEGEALWRELQWPGATPAFTPETFEKEVDTRFGALINLGQTAGYQDLHMGHRVVDEARLVTQYGHKANVRFVALDSMVSNGFQSWAWDGRAQHGGWAAEGLIVQVRPAYADDPLNAWRTLMDPDERADNGRRIASDSARDDALAAANPTGFLPGLSGRLELEGLEEMLSRLKAKSLREEELRLAFLSAYEHTKVESTIFAHEGRHAIDKSLAEKFTTADLEYRAKLSQVVFAPDPRLALVGIFDANIGDPSPHGQANERIMKGLLAWMAANAASIVGLDQSRPLLPQFDRLGDEQIRAAFASLDPMRT